MNTLVIVLIAAVVLVAAYALYGRWLAKTWGIDPKAQTPAVKYNDGKDFVPTNGWTVFSHQFSSIAGAGPVTGAIQAAAFGWLPVLLWVLLGGVFFGAVTDFGALYASVKNDGKSMGMLIEKYIGKLGRKLFLLFCWLFCLIVIAAFADMVAGTFNAYTVVDGVTQLADAAQTNGAAGMVSIMFMVFAVVFGLVQKKLNLSGWKEAALGILCIVASFAVGMNCPLIFGKATWSYITFVYIFFAAVLPMWLLKQPRDYMTTFMFICMIAGAVVGLLVAHPTMNLPVFTGFNNEKLGTMFPILFVTVACGAVSGFHSLVSSGTSSKTVENEKDMLKVGYGAMILESLLAVLALCVAGAAAAADGTPAVGTPFQIFSRGVAGFFEMFGVPSYAATVFMTMCVSALALTSLDAVARIGRMSFQELFSVDDMAHAEPWRKLFCNTYFSTALTLAFGFLPSNIIKKGSMAATTTIRLQSRYFRPPHIFTEKNRRIGTTISMTANANQVRRLTFPWRSIWRIIIPSDGRVYSSSSSEGTSFRRKGFCFPEFFKRAASEAGSSSPKNSSRNSSNWDSSSMTPHPFR